MAVDNKAITRPGQWGPWVVLIEEKVGLRMERGQTMDLQTVSVKIQMSKSLFMDNAACSSREACGEIALS